MDSLLILLPASQETQLMPSCTTYRAQRNNAIGSVCSVIHREASRWWGGIPMQKYMGFGSRWTKAPLLRPTVSSSICCSTLLLYGCAGMQHIELWSWAALWNFTVCPLLQILSASSDATCPNGLVPVRAAVLHEYTLSALILTWGMLYKTSLHACVWSDSLVSCLLYPYTRSWLHRCGQNVFQLRLSPSLYVCFVIYAFSSLGHSLKSYKIVHSFQFSERQLCKGIKLDAVLCCITGISYFASKRV